MRRRMSYAHFSCTGPPAGRGRFRRLGLRRLCGYRAASLHGREGCGFLHRRGRAKCDGRKSLPIDAGSSFRGGAPPPVCLFACPAETAAISSVICGASGASSVIRESAFCLLPHLLRNVEVDLLYLVGISAETDASGALAVQCSAPECNAPAALKRTTSSSGLAVPPAAGLQPARRPSCSPTRWRYRFPGRRLADESRWRGRAAAQCTGSRFISTARVGWFNRAQPQGFRFWPSRCQECQNVNSCTEGCCFNFTAATGRHLSLRFRNDERLGSAGAGGQTGFAHRRCAGLQV